LVFSVKRCDEEKFVAALNNNIGGRGHYFAGFPKGALSNMDPNLIHYGELVVTGASNSGRASHEKALRLISEGAIDVKSLHTHTFELDDVVEGIEFAVSGSGVKVAIVPEIAAE